MAPCGGQLPGTAPFLLVLQKLNSVCGSLFHNIIRPQGTLDFADVSFSQIEHTDAGHSDSASDRIRELAVQDCFLEREFSALFAACFFELAH